MKRILLFLFVAFTVAVQSATLSVRRIVNSAAPPAPTNFVVTLIGNQSTNIYLSWSNQDTNYATIAVERSTNLPVWTTVTNIFGTNTAFTNTHATNISTYYRIKATSSNGLSSLYTDEP